MIPSQLLAAIVLFLISMFGCSNYCVHREPGSIGLHAAGLFDQHVAVSSKLLSSL